MHTSLSNLLEEYSQKRLRPDGTEYHSLLLDGEQEISERTKKTHREVQIAALENEIVPERYCRNQESLNNKEQIRLLNSHVAVVGQGGLGGTVTEILARVGIGHLTLVDADIFEESNLNRQLLSTIEGLGCSKAEAGKKRVHSINPAIEVKAITTFLNDENGIDILAGTDLVVDCLDSIPSRFDLQESCKTLGIPLVSAAIGGVAGQATVIFPEDQGLERIYGAPDTSRQRGVETRLGTLPYTATLMAAIECAEVVEIICRNSSALRNSILLADIAEKRMEKVVFP